VGSCCSMRHFVARHPPLSHSTMVLPRYDYGLAGFSRT
jgi:hypothetical protein